MNTTRSDLDAIDTYADALALLDRQQLLDYAGDELDSMRVLSMVLSTFDPQSVSDVQACVAMIERIVPDWSSEDRYYEGYMGVVCATPAVFAFESLTHFAYEGMSEEEGDAFVQRVTRFFEIAYPITESA